MSEKVLIIGGNGLLGSSLRMISTKFPVEVISPSSQELDVRDSVSLAKALNKYKPKYVINCAGWTNVNLAEEQPEAAKILNTDAVQVLANQLKEMSIPLLHFSTDYVFSGEKRSPYLESDETGAVNKYGETKAAAESILAREFSNSVTIIRTSWLYGRYGNNFAKTIMGRALLNQQEISVVNDQLGQPTCSIELAYWVMDLLVRGVSPGLFNLTNSGDASWAEFAEEILRYFPDSKTKIKQVPSSELLTGANRPKYSILDNTKVIENYGVKMEHWRVALKTEIPFIKSSLAC